jgi:hypothetical protein
MFLEENKAIGCLEISFGIISTEKTGLLCLERVILFFSMSSSPY